LYKASSVNFNKVTFGTGGISSYITRALSKETIVSCNSDENGDPITSANSALLVLNSDATQYPVNFYVSTGGAAGFNAFSIDAAGSTTIAGNATTTTGYVDSAGGYKVGGTSVIANNLNLNVAGLTSALTAVHASAKIYADGGFSSNSVITTQGINVAGPQPSAVQGTIYYDTTQKKFYGYQGTGGWVALA
jgi:hypothetical protein